MAAWINLGMVKPLCSVWECDNCHEAWEVWGILTPLGLGYKECPSCGAEMTGIKQKESA